VSQTTISLKRAGPEKLTGVRSNVTQLVDRLEAGQLGNGPMIQPKGGTFARR